MPEMSNLMRGKRGLIMGVANNRSNAWGIARACREASRDPATVTLVAVSKTFAADAIDPVIAAGQKVFGENRVQEAKAKWPPLLERTPDLELHYRDAPNDWVFGLDGLPPVELDSTIALADQGRNTVVTVTVRCGSVEARDENLGRGFTGMVGIGHDRLAE